MLQSNLVNSKSQRPEVYFEVSKIELFGGRHKIYMANIFFSYQTLCFGRVLKRKSFGCV